MPGRLTLTRARRPNLAGSFVFVAWSRLVDIDCAALCAARRSNQTPVRGLEGLKSIRRQPLAGPQDILPRSLKAPRA